MTADLVYRYGHRVLVPRIQTTAETGLPPSSVAVQARSLRPAIGADFIWITRDNNRLSQD